MLLPKGVALVALLFTSLLFMVQSVPAQEPRSAPVPLKIRIMVVSSYHPDYLWSQATNKGLCAALLEHGYFDNQQQVDAYSKNFQTESSRVIIKKAWMDSKRKNRQHDIALSLARISKDIETFKPDIMLLGDDNAANYLSNQFLDTELPIVFWGINGLPLKYGIIDSLEKPGHNVTGIYQRGYHREAFEFLHKLLPDVKKVAVLSDDSPTGRAHAKNIQRLADEGKIKTEIVGPFVTNSFSEWQEKALKLQNKVDAFYVSTNITLLDDQGNNVDSLQATSWHVRHIHKPEIVPANFMVQAGFLCTVDDSAYRQGYEAGQLAHKIIQGAQAAELAVYSPPSGPFIVNRSRAKMLGLEDIISKNKNMIDQFFEHMTAVEKYPHD